tara:strand:+ start:283 stop:681 length:399 start_codon:yes stop_codon:yes gene_type:complete
LIRRLIILLLIIGCDKSSTEPAVHPLVGVWEMVTISLIINDDETIINSDSNNNEIFIVNEDKTFSSSGERDGINNSGSGTWSTNGNKLILIQNTITTIIDYSINSDILTLNWSDDDSDYGFSYTSSIQYKKQ